MLQHHAEDGEGEQDQGDAVHRRVMDKEASKQQYACMAGVLQGKNIGDQYQYTDRQERPSLAGSLDRRSRRGNKSECKYRIIIIN